MNYSRLLIRNHASKKTTVTSLSIERKRNVNPKFCIQWNFYCLWKWRETKTLRQTNWENLLPAKMPYKNVKGRSPDKRNVIKIRNLNLHQEIKSTGNEVNVGIVFLISLRDNWMLKALTTMPLWKISAIISSNVSSASLSFFFWCL